MFIGLTVMRAYLSLFANDLSTTNVALINNFIRTFYKMLFSGILFVVYSQYKREKPSDFGLP